MPMKKYIYELSIETTLISQLTVVTNEAYLVISNK